MPKFIYEIDLNYPVRRGITVLVCGHCPLNQRWFHSLPNNLILFSPSHCFRWTLWLSNLTLHLTRGEGGFESTTHSVRSRCLTYFAIYLWPNWWFSEKKYERISAFKKMTHYLRWAELPQKNFIFKTLLLLIQMMQRFPNICTTLAL